MKIASRVLFVFACVTGAMSVLTAAYVAHQSVELFRPITPYGGMAFVLGWLALAVSAFERHSQSGKDTPA